MLQCFPSGIFYYTILQLNTSNKNKCWPTPKTTTQCWNISSTCLKSRIYIIEKPYHIVSNAKWLYKPFETLSILHKRKSTPTYNQHTIHLASEIKIPGLHFKSKLAFFTTHLSHCPKKIPTDTKIL